MLAGLLALCAPGATNRDARGLASQHSPALPWPALCAQRPEAYVSGTNAHKRKRSRSAGRAGCVRARAC